MINQLTDKINNYFNQDSKSILLLLLVSLTVLIPQTNGMALLLQGDEFMHVRTIRESLNSGSLFIPILSGLPNVYKPPLLFWFGEIFDSILGQGLLSERFSSILFGAGTVLLIYRLLRDLRKSIPYSIFWAMLYLFTLGVFKFSRLAMMEQGMAFFYFLCSVFFIRYIHRRKIKYLTYAGLFAGIGYLFKGPILPIYFLLLMSVWSSIHLFRFQLSPFKIKTSFTKLIQIIKEYTIFLIFCSIVPIFYYSILIQKSEYGLDLVKFFIVVENIGKFSRENQPVYAILIGFLKYTFPWSIILFASVKLVFKKPALTFSLLSGKILVFGGFLIFILHLIPNRKDEYYVIPAIPLLFAGAGILFNKVKDIPKIYWRLNLYFMLFASIILFLSFVYLGFHRNLWIMAIGVTYLLVIFILLKLKGQIIFKNFILGTFSILIFQFVALPAFHYPLLPNDLIISKQEVCVLSDNVWKLYGLEMYSDKYKYKHGSPSFPETCGNSDYAIIAIGTHSLPKNKNFEQIRTWAIWKEGISFDEFISGLTNSEKIKEHVYLYEVTQ